MHDQGSPSVHQLLQQVLRCSVGMFHEVKHFRHPHSGFGPGTKTNETLLHVSQMHLKASYSVQRQVS